jgi:hypothetical protein
MCSAHTHTHTHLSKNLYSARGQIAKLFIAIFVNYAFWRGKEYPKVGAVVAYFLADRSLGAGGKYSFIHSFIHFP